MDLDTKINRVIASCQNPEQLATAARYLDCAARNRRSAMNSRHPPHYWAGVITGIHHAMTTPSRDCPL